MNKTNVTISKTLESYNKKYKNRKFRLLKYTKKEVEEFDKKYPSDIKHMLLQNRKWTLIGDTYYEIPRAPRLTWFRNLNAACQVGSCVLLAGAIAGTSVGIYYGVTHSNNNVKEDESIVIDIDASATDIAEIESKTMDEEGNFNVIIKSKQEDKEITEVKVKIGSTTLKEDEYEFNEQNSGKKYKVTIFKATLKKYKGKVVITPKTDDQPEPKPETEGNLFHVYCWNTEFLSFFNKYVSDEGKALLAKGEIMEYEQSISLTGLHLNNKDVKFTMIPSNDGQYRKALNEALKNNKTAKEEDKVDLFLVEADYMVDYVDSEYSHDISKVGITDEDLKYTYNYANEMATDINGIHKGVSFQVCPSAFLYRRSIVKEIFGTDEPDAVQNEVSDWDKFIAIAAVLAAGGAGNKIAASVFDLYRAKTANLSTPWVTNKALSIPNEVDEWLDMSKKFIDNDYSTTVGTWDSDHSSYLAQSLCMIAPSWYYNYCMGSLIYTSGDWAICEGPEPSYWGGTWMLAAEGGDNDSLVAKTMKDFLSNEDEVLSNMVKVEKVMVNNSAYNDKIADTLPGNEFLGGQNDYKVLSSIAKNIKINRSAVTTYDQVCNEQYQSAMKSYLNGEATKDEALAVFKKVVKEIYPEIQVE